MKFVWNSAIKEIKGDGDVKSIVLKNLKTGEVSEQATDGVFVYIGFHPINEFMIGAVNLDAAGHVVTDIQMNTSVSGVFAAGDVRTFSERQLANAVGDGVAAALAAYRYITEG
jgi:thioredoxin reductase (NADPH)